MTVPRPRSALKAACPLMVALLVSTGCRSSSEHAIAERDRSGIVTGLQQGPTLRVVPHGRYFVDGERTATPREQLPDRLEALPGKTLQLVAYEGVVGYDVSMALQAAREAGFEQVEGIAEYPADGSTPDEASLKRWRQDLTKRSRPVALTPDSARRF